MNLTSCTALDTKQTMHSSAGLPLPTKFISLLAFIELLLFTSIALTALPLTALLLTAALPHSAQASAQLNTSIEFQDRGKPTRTESLDQLKAAVPPQTIKIFELHEQAEVEFIGLPTDQVLDHIYGPAWRRADTALFTATDGYRNPVPVERLAHHKSWLAFQRKDREIFTLTEKQPILREVVLGPYFLIWDTLGDPDSKKEGATNWPYQVIKIDLVTFADQYPALIPPKRASAQALRGFEHYRKLCISCHSINGQGGKLAPELNTPVSVTTYWKEDWLKKWIANPSSLRAGTSMPAVVPPGREQARMIDELFAYLKVMAPLSK
jgi:cytochrome c2